MAQYPPDDIQGFPDRPVAGGGGRGDADKLTDVYQRLGSIEKSVTYLEADAQDSRRKLDQIIVDIASARASFRTVKVVASILGSLLALVWTFIAAVVMMIAKHYLKW